MEEDPHEPIKQKQIKMCQSINKLKPPSKETRINWIYATNQSTNYPQSTLSSGKWLIFVPYENIDSIWFSIERITIAGMLGDASKVSTKLMRKMKKSTEHVICVYTYDNNDKDDVMRIKKQLEKIVGDRPLHYKTNKETLENN